MKGFSTKAVHGSRNKKEVHGALRIPVYDSVAFEHESAQDIQLSFEGKKPAHSYSRITNPTVEEFEQRMRLLSGGMSVLALSSGMAAITNLILTLAESGTNLITTRHLFGNTLSLFDKTLKPWGLEIRYVSMLSPDSVEQAIDNKTRMVFLETMTNPQLEVANCSKIASVTKKHNVPLIVDNTLMTPYLFNSPEHGVNVEVLSSTKYISGGATSVGGVIIDYGNYDWRQSTKMTERAKKTGKFALISALRQEVYRNLGGCMSPHTAYLQTLGLETMSLRIEKSCSNAMLLSEFLKGHSKVKHVHYPGLKASPFHSTAKEQFNKKFGGLLTFDLESKEACFSLMNNLHLIRRATNLNDNKTLVLHPSSTIFCEYSEKEKTEMGVRPTMVRLAVGIEDHEDLITDLKKGLKGI